MKTISVPDMMCENCVKRITGALKGAGLNFEVNLPGKTVSVEGGDEQVHTAVAKLEDLGFSPEIR